jgi:hypothetical protein
VGKYGKEYSKECRRRKEPLNADEKPETLADYIMEIGEEAYEDEIIEHIRGAFPTGESQ